jgi:metal-responsive CopG/Arc/MetJ family transcriptional regulator
MPELKPIHINLPTMVVKQLDDVAAVLSQTRSDVIRRAISNHLQLGARHEVAHAQMSEAEVHRHYKEWAKIVGLAA